jgi:DNA-binding MarR family transcriptional regulator
MSTTRTRRAVPAAEDTQTRAFRGLVRTFGLLERVMEPFFARFGISGPQWSVLVNLHRAELEGLVGLRLCDIGQRMLVRPPTVTGVVDRLERAGLVTRNGAPDDLRAKIVSLTDKGRAVVDKVQAVRTKQIDSVMGVLDAAEMADLDKLLNKLGRHLADLSVGM